MIGFYEEMADLAAMSEDDGFLGQCAGSQTVKSEPEEFLTVPSLPPVNLLRHEPRQLKLVTFQGVDRDTNT
jgi:hypothetical protein